MRHIIKPLLLSTVLSEKGPMTYLSHQGESVVRPYVMWFIRAGDKNVLVDTAIEAEDYRNYHPGFNKVPFQSVQNFEEALAQVECEPADIDIVIQTHLHMDHMYNTHKCSKAVVFVQAKELEFALNPHPIFEVLYPRDMIQKLKIEVVDGDHTILPGVKVMAAPGHSPGCQAVIVETQEGKTVISGCCTIMDNFYPPEDVKTSVSPFATYPVIAPGIHSDLFQAYKSALKIKEIADIIIPVHDPEMALRKEIP
jgi:glyoxylase-like metal-dependent hydrolase (beta-lactamase superfamily II)